MCTSPEDPTLVHGLENTLARRQLHGSSAVMDQEQQEAPPVQLDGEYNPQDDGIIDAPEEVSRLGLWTFNTDAPEDGRDEFAEPIEGVKIFVGGLARQTKSSDLAEYFAQFGTVVDAVVMYNHSLGVSRGFGFVTFVDKEIADHVLAQRHTVHNKSVEAKLAIPRDPTARSTRRDGPRDRTSHRKSNRPQQQKGGGQYMGKGNGYHNPRGGGLGGGNQVWTQPTIRAGAAAFPQGQGQGQRVQAAPAPAYDAGCKLFIGGLSWDTDESGLLQYFSQYGEVMDAMVVYNHTMGVSRGFGFVTFKERSVAEAMVEMIHCINEKTVEAKLALPKGEHVAESLEEKMSKQIFVGGLPHNTTSDQLKEWAQRQFGPHNLANAIAVIDLKTKVTRGFGFIQFTTPEMVDFAVQIGLHYEMSSKKVTVKRAQAHQPMMQEMPGMQGMMPMDPMEMYQQFQNQGAMEQQAMGVPQFQNQGAMEQQAMGVPQQFQTPGAMEQAAAMGLPQFQPPGVMDPAAMGVPQFQTPGVMDQQAMGVPQFQNPGGMEQQAAMMHPMQGMPMQYAQQVPQQMVFNGIQPAVVPELML